MRFVRYEVVACCAGARLLAVLIALGGFQVAAADSQVEAISGWLAERSASAAEDWERSLAEAERRTRLAQPLRRAAAEADTRFASVAAESPAAPPGWLGPELSAEDRVVASSLRLAVAEELWRQRRCDACLAWLQGVEEAETFSPALCWYLRAIVAQQTVDDETASAALAELDTLCEASEVDPLGVARRWVVEAMRSELAKEAEPVPTIARQMRDAHRRIARRSPADETRRRQEEILAALDELIDKLEKQRQQQQQQQQQAAAGGQGGDPDSAMEESRPRELKGPGEVDPKRLVAGDDWGALPPAERERLTQAITRDFPPHYRALVEGYFRTLAERPEESSDPNSADADK